MGEVISLAAARAVRQARRPAAPTPAAKPKPTATVRPKPTRTPRPTSPPPLLWRQSQRGNPWTQDPRTGIHLVLYETRRGWSGRATPPDGEGFYVNLPEDISSAEEARAWAEGWLAEAAGQLAEPHAS